METAYLAHHGIKGQKWGVRRFQNSDGSLTNQGKRRYLSDETKGKIKKAAKVAAGVAGAAALGYGVYKIGRAGHKLKMVTAYKHASDVAGNLGTMNAHAAGLSRASGNHVNAKYYERLADMYIGKSRYLGVKASDLRSAGGVADRLAYNFVESLIKDPHVDWSTVDDILSSRI